MSNVPVHFSDQDHGRPSHVEGLIRTAIFGGLVMPRVTPGYPGLHEKKAVLLFIQLPMYCLSRLQPLEKSTAQVQKKMTFLQVTDRLHLQIVESGRASHTVVQRTFGSRCKQRKALARSRVFYNHAQRRGIYGEAIRI
jgi:hypothetical protein